MDPGTGLKVINTAASAVLYVYLCVLKKFTTLSPPLVTLLRELESYLQNLTADIGWVLFLPSTRVFYIYSSTFLSFFFLWWKSFVKLFMQHTQKKYPSPVSLFFFFFKFLPKIVLLLAEKCVESLVLALLGLLLPSNICGRIRITLFSKNFEKNMEVNISLRWWNHSFDWFFTNFSTHSPLNHKFHLKKK